MGKTIKDQLDSLKKKEEQIKAKIQRLKAREDSAERKKDTRRKIIIGGAILAAVKSGEWSQEQLLSLLDKKVAAEKDRELFGLDLEPKTAL